MARSKVLVRVPGVMIRKARLRSKMKVFMGAVTNGQLRDMTIDPLLTQVESRRNEDPRIKKLYKLQLEIQRHFKGRKKGNVRAYKEYIKDVFEGGIGICPPIYLYSREVIPCKEYGSGASFMQVPKDAVFAAIDGETQLAARHDIGGLDGDVVPIFVIHDATLVEAKQCFHDLNREGVTCSSADGLRTDSRDPATQLVREVEKRINYFTGRIDWRKQLFPRFPRSQVRRAPPPSVFIPSAVRQMIRGVVEGKKGIDGGAKSVVDKDAYDSKVATEVVMAMLAGMARIIRTYEPDLRTTVFYVATVWPGIGAAAHPILSVKSREARRRKINKLLDSISSIDWTRDQRWSGICLKFTPDGVGKSDGSRDAPHLVLKVIVDEDSLGFEQVRRKSKGPVFTVVRDPKKVPKKKSAKKSTRAKVKVTTTVSTRQRASARG